MTSCLFQVDALSQGGADRNPAAVMPLERGSARRDEAIAGEQLSETAFTVRADGARRTMSCAGSRRRLRWRCAASRLHRAHVLIVETRCASRPLGRVRWSRPASARARPAGHAVRRESAGAARGDGLCAASVLGREGRRQCHRPVADDAAVRAETDSDSAAIDGGSSHRAGTARPSTAAVAAPWHRRGPGTGAAHPHDAVVGKRLPDS